MKCPYCEGIMEEEIIQSAQELFWTKEASLLGRAKFHERSVVLSKLAMIRGSKVIAYLCRHCEKIVIDYANGKSDANHK